MEMEDKLDTGLGYAVIFNHETFHRSLNKRERQGTTNDLKELQKVFEKFKIEVHVHQDFTLNRIQEEVKILSNFDFTPYECLIIVILSHGKENNILYAHDWHYNLNDTIVNPIVNTNTSLEGKPKIFVIQACKPSLKYFMETDHVGSSSFPALPLSDMYLAFSTFEGFVSQRYVSSGGIFIQKFCELLMKYGVTRSISTIMEQVIHELLRENKKQVPMVLTTMSKPFIFGDIGKGKPIKIVGIWDLPEEMILEIFSYLTLASFKNLCLVCNHLNSLFHRSITKYKLVLVSDEDSFHKYKTNLKERTILNVKFKRINFVQNNENIKYLKERFINLKFLSFEFCNITEDQLITILQLTKNLQTLEINGSQSLEIDDSQSLENSSNNCVQDILENLTNMRFSELNKRNLNSFTKLIKMMPNLQNLTVHPNKNYWENTSVNHFEMLASTLRSISILNNKGLSNSKLSENIVKAKNLKLTKLIFDQKITSVLLESIVKCQQSITHLQIYSIYGNDGLITICDSLPNLQTLHIKHCNTIQNEGFKVLWKLKKLRYLSLNNCLKVTDQGLIKAFQDKNDNLQSLTLGGLKSCQNLLMHLTNEFNCLRELNLGCKSGIKEEEIQNIWAKLTCLRKLDIDCIGLRLSDSAYAGEIQNETDVRAFSIANIKELQYLNLEFGNNITVATLKEIAKLKELVFLHADFSNSNEIEFKELHILSSCKLLTNMKIKFSNTKIPEEEKDSLKAHFGRIESFDIESMEEFSFYS